MPEGKDGLLARTLYILVRDHKQKCEGDCSISMFLVGELFENLVKRKMTEEEFKNFM